MGSPAFLPDPVPQEADLGGIHYEPLGLWLAVSWVQQGEASARDGSTSSSCVSPWQHRDLSESQLLLHLLAHDHPSRGVLPLAYEW